MLSIGRSCIDAVWESAHINVKPMKDNGTYLSIVDREWQLDFFNKHRTQQYILLNAPTAAGKTIALLAVLIYKLNNNPSMKAIICAPQTMIGIGFLHQNIIFPDKSKVDFNVLGENDLCSNTNGLKDKAARITSFVNSDLTGVDANYRVLVCTHAALNLAYTPALAKAFNNILLIVDEAHHLCSGSAEDGSDQNKLAYIINECMKNKAVDIILSTATWMRGDADRILPAVSKDVFEHYKVFFDKYLEDCRDLEGFNFRHVPYIRNVQKVLTALYAQSVEKDIVFIPSVSRTENKITNTYKVLFAISQIKPIPIERYNKYYIKDINTPIWEIRRGGTWIKVMNLVDDTSDRSAKKLLIEKAHANDGKDIIDVIIALDMMIEGANWKWANREIILGNRGSFTELMQMLGRVLRDAPGKKYVQVYQFFETVANITSKAKAENKEKLNNVTKAIFSSLLLENLLCFKIPKLRSGRSDDYIRMGDYFATGESWDSAIQEIQKYWIIIEASQVLTKEQKEQKILELFSQEVQKQNIIRNDGLFPDPAKLYKYFKTKLQNAARLALADIKLASKLDAAYLKSIDIDLLIEESPCLAAQYIFSTTDCNKQHFDIYKRAVIDHNYEDAQEHLNAILEAKKKKEAWIESLQIGAGLVVN